MAFADLSDSGAVKRAIEQFDELGRDSFLKKYKYGPARSAFVVWNGKYYDAKAIIGAAHGFQFPDQGPLPWQAFGGGEAGAAPKLRSLGFEVTTEPPPIPDVAIDPAQLRTGIERLLDEYAEARTEPFGKEHPIWATFADVADLLRRSAPVRTRDHIEVRWSCGQGNWARVPWIALLDTRATTTIKSGVYGVYLFREDLSGVYLTLNQGVQEITGRLGKSEGIAQLERLAAALRPQLADLADAGFSLDNRIDLRSSADLGQKYEHSTIAHRFYEADRVPSGDDLLSDVDALLSAYDRYAAARTERASDRHLDRVVMSFSDGLRECGLIFGDRHVDLARAFVASFATKPFVILTGLSGSGKTQLAIQFGAWLGESRTTVVPVRPDWTGAESILGYEDALQPVKDGRRAWHVPEVLAFLLQATRDPDNPYLLVLDEMNLAHVERYFADVLSGMESHEPVLPDLYRDDADADGRWRQPDDADKLEFPQNLFIAGTVNVDETTYMFSPKVLDRANTIEFRVEADELSEQATKPTRCAPGDPSLIRGFLEIATDDRFQLDHPPPYRSELVELLKSLHRLMAEGAFEFGHRVFYEALRFSSMLYAAGEPRLEAALDLQVLQKILPRLHGSRRRLEALLCGISRFCYDLTFEAGSVSDVTAVVFDPLTVEASVARLPLSFVKLQRMTRILRANQFVSFAE